MRVLRFFEPSAAAGKGIRVKAQPQRLHRAHARIRLAGALAVGGLLLGLSVAPPAAAATHAAATHAAATHAAAPHAAAAAPNYTDVCPPVPAGYDRCEALVRTDVGAADRGPLELSPTGYSPANLQAAYNLAAAAAAGGSGQTVALVDAYNDPNINADLNYYRSYFGLTETMPTCDEANGCFKVVSQTGSTTALPATPPAGDDWTLEESLDVDMVSAICPNCHIDLVEANSATASDLGTAMDEAVALGAKFVSNSYGGAESSAETSDDAYYNHPGVVVTASAGDAAYGVLYPAASPYVTAVGGTTLTSAPATARGWTETAWGGTGSGCSAYEPKPSWQTDTGCARRTVADVAADADPDTGVSIYDTYGEDGGWNEVGGTSAASPIIASVYALAGTPAANSYPAQYPYQHTTSLYDVTSGSNGTCSPTYLCTAGVGYDGPTGWGTPDGTTAFTPATIQSAFQANTGALWTYSTSAGSANLNQGMMTGTSPVIADLTTGGDEIAFQSNTGYLYTYGAGGSVNTGQSMRAGTSPGIAALPGGGYEIAFQAPNSALVLYTSAGGVTNTALGMMAGTSPSIAVSAAGAVDVAFQANTGYLWTYSPTAGATDVNASMAANTSPSITALGTGGFETAYQAGSNGALAVYGSGGDTNTGIGMMAATSPAIAASPGNGFDVAVQANTGILWTYSSTGVGTDVDASMMAGTSPAITSLGDGGYYETVYQASNSALVLSGVVNLKTGLGMKTTTSPAIAF
jgi:subtilase family serine protease